jgi:hypothetical protein
MKKQLAKNNVLKIAFQHFTMTYPSSALSSLIIKAGFDFLLPY